MATAQFIAGGTIAWIVWRWWISATAADPAYVRRVLADISITFMPHHSFNVVEAHGELTVELYIAVQARDGREGVITVKNSVTRKWWPRSERVISLVIRSLCARSLLHELDETFLVAGDRVFDPHGPRPAPKEWL